MSSSGSLNLAYITVIKKIVIKTSAIKDILKWQKLFCLDFFYTFIKGAKKASHHQCKLKDTTIL